MRIPVGWNVLLLISLLLILTFLNYFNILPLSQAFPFLSFLPHSSKTEISQQIVTSAPQPLPPITVKKIDLVKGEGEFVINNPAPQVVQASPEKQILLDGTYDTNSKKITIQTTVQDSTIPIHPIPPAFNDTSTTALTLKMIIGDKPIYQTYIPLINLEKTSSLPFRVRLPFYNELTVKIYEGAQELLSQPIKL